MIVLKSMQALRNYLSTLPTGSTTGFVPTMGGLHAGHTSLMEASALQNSHTIASIYVNPKQFSPTEDLSTYPRPLEADLSACRLAGVTAVFTPTNDDIYPPNFNTHIITDVGSAQRNNRSEGAHRPTFFEGVATVVTVLLSLIRPSSLYIGQKDAQQCAVIQSIVRDLFFTCKVCICPTVREQDGLAMSSRNSYLTSEERKKAPALWRALCAGRKAFEEGERNATEIRKKVDISANKNGVKLAYISVCERWNMREMQLIDNQETLLCAATIIGRTRLIDNLLLIGH